MTFKKAEYMNSFKKFREQLISINRLSLLSGISRNQIYNIESGRSIPRLDTAFLLWFIISCYSSGKLSFFELWQDYFKFKYYQDPRFSRSSENSDCEDFSLLQLLAEPEALKKEKNNFGVKNK